MAVRNQILNTTGAGGTKYYTTTGLPYTNVVNPDQVPDTDNNEALLGDIDKTRRPREKYIVVHDPGALKASIADNGGARTGISVVKTSNPARYNTYHRLFNPDRSNDPFVIYGSGIAVGGKKRLAGSSPQLYRFTDIKQITSVQPQYELTDPANPYSFKVVGYRNSIRFLDDYQNGSITVAQPSPSHFLNIATSNSMIVDSETTYDIPKVSSVETVQVGLNLDLTPLIGGHPDDETTVTIDWGDGGTKTTGVESGSKVSHAYTKTGNYTVTLSLDPAPEGSKTETFSVFMRALDYVPADLSFGTITITPPTAPSRKATFKVVANGYPNIQLFVNYSDNTGSLQGYYTYSPTSFTLDAATFDFEHVFRKGGSFVVDIYAEHLTTHGRQQIHKVEHVNIP